MAFEWNELDGPTIAPAVPAIDERLGTASRLRKLLVAEQSSPTSDLTPKRPARLVALSRLTREGGWEALSFWSFRIEFGHGCDRPAMSPVCMAEP